MKALVTGGAGFIGGHLTDRLVADGYQVRVLDNLSNQPRPTYDSARYVDFVLGDVRDKDACKYALRGVDVVFHLAALTSVQRSILDPVSCHDVNVTGTLNILMASREARAQRVVLASSSSVYGDSPELPKRETMTPQPVSPYALSKLTGEYYAQQFYQHYALETVSLRYFNVFGAGQNPKCDYAAVIPRFVTAARSGDRPVIFGDGEQTRDFIAVQNVVDATVLAGESRSAPGRTYNIGSGEGLSLNRLVEEIGGIVGRRIQPVYGPPRRGDIRHSVADIEAAERELRWGPRVSVARALEELLGPARMLRAA